MSVLSERICQYFWICRINSWYIEKACTSGSNLECSTTHLLSNYRRLGGNQRDLARLKAMKKQQEMQKSKGASDKDGNKGLSLEARKQRWTLLVVVTSDVVRVDYSAMSSVCRDADMMREKQKLKEAKAGEAAGGAKKWQILYLWAVHKGFTSLLHCLTASYHYRVSCHMLYIHSLHFCATLGNKYLK